MIAAPQRLWLLELEAKAGFRFEGEQQITLTADEKSMAQIVGIRLRNQFTYATDEVGESAPKFVGGFVVEAVGSFANAEEAFATLGNLANPYFQIFATLSNAGVEESEDRFAYAPSPSSEEGSEGEFVLQRHSQARAPVARLRKVRNADAAEVLLLLNGHGQEERLQRAMSHYKQALNQLDHVNRVLPAESLWLVVENLTSVVFHRLCSEAGINPEDKDAKHRLALSLGFTAKSLPDHVQALVDSGQLLPEDVKYNSSHLGKLDGYIRREILFAGDKGCYKNLKDMSDGFEHGFMSFSTVRAKSKVADRAFAYLRRAILTEIGLRSDSPLFEERFDGPQGIWRPVMEAQGIYTDSSDKRVDLRPETLNDPWPDPPRLSLVPRIVSVLDDAEGVRTITMEANGSMNAVVASQTVTVTGVKWLSPAAADTNVLRRVSTSKLNGEVISEEVVIPPV